MTTSKHDSYTFIPHQKSQISHDARKLCGRRSARQPWPRRCHRQGTVRKPCQTCTARLSSSSERNVLPHQWWHKDPYAPPIIPLPQQGQPQLTTLEFITVAGSGPGSFIYFTEATDQCHPQAPFGDGQSCTVADFTFSIIETAAFDNCDEMKGAQRDSWDRNLVYSGSYIPADYPNQFSTHGFGRCQQDTVHFFRQSDGFV